MTATAQPGTCGAAARLPNRPGNQKPTPPSSARACSDVAVPSTAAASTAVVKSRAARTLLVAFLDSAVFSPCIAASPLLSDRAPFYSRVARPGASTPSSGSFQARCCFRVTALVSRDKDRGTFRDSRATPDACPRSQNCRPAGGCVLSLAADARGRLKAALHLLDDLVDREARWPLARRVVLEGREELTDDGLRGIEDASGVSYGPVVVGVGCDIGPLVGV